MGSESGDRMTDEDTQIVNHALACLPNQWQDEREAARAALHRMFRKQVKAEKDLAFLRHELSVAGKAELVRELERLREALGNMVTIANAKQARLHRIEEAIRKSPITVHPSILRAALEEKEPLITGKHPKSVGRDTAALDEDE